MKSGWRTLLIGLGTVFSLGSIVAVADYAATVGSGTTFGSAVVSTVHYAKMIACDLTAPATQCQTVTAGGAALVTGTGGTFPVTGTVAVSSGTVAATQSGTWTVQPGNTANSTAWLVTGAGGTFPATQSGTWTVNPTTAANWGVGATGAAVPANGIYSMVNVGGTSRGWTASSLGSTFAGHIAVVDGSGNQVTSFGGSNASVGATAAAVPASATYLGINSGGNLVGAVAGSGTSTGAMRVELPTNGTGLVTTNPGTAANWGIAATGAAVPANAQYICIISGGNCTGWTGAVTITSGTTAVTQSTSPWIVAGGGTAGSAATGVVTVQGIASMTPLFVSSATAPVSTMNSASANAGINAAMAAVFDDTSPTAITENSFGALRISTNRNLYSTLRDAAGNERGANVNASNQLAVQGPVTMVSGAVASGAYASGSFASGALASGSVASGAIASGAMVDLGQQTDAVCATATGTCSLIALQKYNNNATIGSVAAGTNIIGYTTLDPCSRIAKVNVAISQTASTQVVTGTSAKNTYICSLTLIAGAAEIVAITAGTGSVCATSAAAVLGSTTVANGISLAANGGITFGNGLGAVAVANDATADNVCLLQSTSSRVSGVLTYVQE